MKCEACGYKFLFASSTKCPSCGDPREDIVKESDIQAAMDALRADTVSVVGPWKEPDAGVFVWGNAPSNAHTEPQVTPKRPFEHDPAVVAVTDEMIAAALGAASGIQLALHDDDAATIYRAMAAVAPFGVIPWTSPVPITESVVGLKAANAHLTRQLAAQALAHAEQMEGAQRALKKLRVAELEAENAKLTLALAGQNIHAQQIVMRVTPATQPTDAQQTVGDVKAAPERRPDGTLKPVAKAWEAPKQASDARRVGS